MQNHSDSPGAFTSLVGHTLGGLEFIELLADGETTAVYRARQPALNRQVAVKVLSPEEGRDPAFVTRFTQAALAAAAVEHPNIVQVFHAAEHRGCHYVVMELVHGESLAALLKQKGRLDAAEALSLMKQAAAGLAAAHAAGVVHGDLQPSNLLVSQGGQLKVADFSLARCTASEKGPAAASTPPSHPLYFPPEAARGRRLDARSDLYLLGCTFYHVLAGRPPFEADTPEALALKHVREEATPLNVAAPKTPLVFCHLIHHLLRKNPDERFQTADDLVGALERIEGELEAERHPAAGAAGGEAEAAIAPASRPVKRVLVASAAIVLLVGVGYVAFVLGRGHKPLARPPVSTATPVPAQKPETKVGTEVSPVPRVEEPKAEPKIEPKAEPKVVPEAPAWQAAWDEAAAKANALAEVGRFGEAVACYEGLVEQRNDPALRERVAAAQGALKKAAEDALRDAAARAERLAGQKDFAGARAEIQGIIQRCGVPSVVADARKLLAAVEDKEKAAKAVEGPSREAAELARQREAETLAARALEPIEPLVKAWNFAGAAQAAAKLQPANPDVAALLALRADELRRLAELKAKMIERINTAEPKLMKSTVLIPGLNGPLTGADEADITVSHPLLKARKRETHAWAELTERGARGLALASMDKKRADDWLALGLLAITLGEPAAAEEDFAKVRSMGGDVSRHLAPLARAALGRANDLLAKRDFRGAAAELDALEGAYGKSPWLKIHAADLAAAREQAKAGLAEATADGLLARAAECMKKDEPFEARRLLALLKADHATSKAVTDTARKPSFAELSEAVAKLDLGPLIIVRKDGKGDARSIAEAIQAAAAQTRIEVQDGETYAGRLVIPEAKAGLHLRAKEGCWPVVTVAADAAEPALVEVGAERVTIEGLVLALGSVRSPVREGRALWVRAGPLRLRRAVVAVAPARSAAKVLSMESEPPADCDLQGCLIAGSAILRANTQARDTLWLAGRLKAEQGAFHGENLVLLEGADLNAPAELRFCTIPGVLTLRDGPNALADSILSSVDSTRASAQMSQCLLFPSASLGVRVLRDKVSVFRSPQFADERAFDFRLRPASPGRGAASDRGDQGCRYSPAMVELLKQAHDLRRKGILAF